MTGSFAGNRHEATGDAQPGRIYVGGAPPRIDAAAAMPLQPMPTPPAPAPARAMSAPAMEPQMSALDRALATSRASYRINWANVATALLVLAAMASTVVWAARLGEDRPQGSVAVPAEGDVLGPSADAVEAAANDARMRGMSDAMSAMRQARALVDAGKLDEARQELDSIGLEFVAGVGADDLLDEVDALIRQRDELVEVARAHIESGDAQAAVDAIRRLEGFTQVPEDLADARATLTRQLAISQRKREIRTMIADGKAAEALDLARRSRDAYGDTFAPLVAKAKARLAATDSRADQTAGAADRKGDDATGERDGGGATGVAPSKPKTAGGSAPKNSGNAAAAPPGAATGGGGAAPPAGPEGLNSPPPQL